MNVLASSTTTTSNTHLKSIYVKIVSDVVCPFCFIGLRNLQKASEESGVSVTYEFEPFLLDEDSTSIPAEGIPLLTVLSKKYGTATAQQLLFDPNSSVNRLGRMAGIQFNNERKAYSSYKAHILSQYIKEQGGDNGKIMEELFQFHFVHGGNINDELNLIELANKVYGGKINIPIEIFQDKARMDAIRRISHEFTTGQMRVSGVPFFIIEDINGNAGDSSVTFSGAQPANVMVKYLIEAAGN